VGRGRETFEMVFHRFVQQFVVRKQIRKMPELGVIRQFAGNQQMRHLDKCRLLRQLFDGNSTIAQDPLLAINESHFAHARTGIPVPVVQSDVTRFVSQ